MCALTGHDSFIRKHIQAFHTYTHTPLRAVKTEPLLALHTRMLPSLHPPMMVLLLGDHTHDTARPAPVSRARVGAGSEEGIKSGAHLTQVSMQTRAYTQTHAHTNADTPTHTH